MTKSPADHVPGTEPGIGATGGGAVMASLTPLAEQYLDQTRPWVRFMSVVTFGGAGLMVLVGLVMLAVGLFSGLAGTSTGGLGPLGSAIGGGVMALLYLALACVYIAPGLYLWRYADAIQRLKTDSTTSGLEDALKHQKSFWRFVGIVTAIGLVVGVIAVGLAIMAGLVGALMAARS